MLFRDQVIFFIFFGAIVFYQLNSYSNEKLLSIIIITIFGFFGYYYLNNQYKVLSETNAISEDIINLESEKRKEANSEIYNINKFPKKKKFKYIFKNKIMVEIVEDLNILRMFDKARYGDLILNMDNLQKIYIYILGNRYEPRSYIPTFIDVSDKILEILYSLIFVIPESFKHVYGVNTEEILTRNVERFTALKTKMLTILENYAKAEHNIKFLPEIYPRPSNNYNSIVLF